MPDSLLSKFLDNPLRDILYLQSVRTSLLPTVVSILLFGLQIPRSPVRLFEHNDLRSLEDVLLGVEKERQKRGGPLTRRCIVIEPRGHIREGHGHALFTQNPTYYWLLICINRTS